MKAKLILFSALFLVSSFFQSCQSQSMETNKVIQEITRNLKQYSAHPTYYIAVYSGACSFELLVNDMPVYKYYDRDNIGGQTFPFNDCILKSGAQTWSLKVLPPTSTNKDSLLPGLVDDAYFRLVLKVKDWKANTPMETLDTLYEAPSIMNNGERFLADAGKPMIMANGTFRVQVPFELPGWSKSVNLAKENKDKLLQEAIAVYNKERELLKEKKFVEELEFSKNATYEFMQSMYRTEVNIMNSIKDDLEVADGKGYKVPELENFTLVFYGNGSVVGFERTDLISLGESALRVEYMRKNDERVQFRQLLLHRPRPSAPLEPIR